MNHQQLQLADLARLVQGECIGQTDLRLSALASLEQATSHDLAFVNADKYVEQANQSQAGALIVTGPEIRFTFAPSASAASARA